MRKLLSLVIIAAAFVTACGTVQIAMDSQSPEGDRLVLTSDNHLFGDLYLALGARVSPKDTVYAILITSEAESNHGIFDKDDRLLIRLADSSVIQLYNLYHKEFEKETETNVNRTYTSAFGYGYAYDPYVDAVFLTPYEIGTFVPRVTTRTVSKSYALYSISRKQLNRIMSQPVIKLRVEIEDDELNMPNTEKVSDMFKQEFDCLHDRIKTTVKRTEF